MSDDLIDVCMDFLVRWVFVPFIFVGTAAIISLGLYAGGSWLNDKLNPTQARDKTIEIVPFYWSCTDAYVSHVSARSGMLTRFGRTSDSPAYDECRCRQWSAHMVGKEHEPDAKCRNGWTPSELSGIR